MCGSTQTPGHRWLHYGSTWQSLASAKTQSLHQAQNIHLSCAVGNVIWFWNVDNAQSRQCNTIQFRQWQDPVFSHADTASYPWYQMVWQSIQRSSQWENETTRLLLLTDVIHYFGHICRLPKNTPASQALQPSIEAHTGTPPAADWKRPPGRPRRNWLQQVEEDIGLSVGAAWIAGQDRSMWKTLRPSAGQAQQWVSEWVCGSKTDDELNNK